MFELARTTMATKIWLKNGHGRPNTIMSKRSGRKWCQTETSWKMKSKLPQQFDDINYQLQKVVAVPAVLKRTQ